MKAAADGEQFANLLARYCRQLRVQLSPEQVERLYAHYRLLVRWNERINLTAIRSLEEAVERHYAESLFVATRLPEGRWVVADIGSGAGFPGIGIAILRPECRVILVERRLKKAVFLKEATAGWENVEVFEGDASELAGRQIDWVVSRAVALEELARVAGRLCRRLLVLTSEARLEEWLERQGEGQGVALVGKQTLPWNRQLVVAELLIGQGKEEGQRREAF